MILWVSQPNLPVPLPFASRTATLNFCNSHTGKDGERFYAPIWCPDSQAKACAVCQASFTTFRRKYHCRLCGHIICKYVVIPLSLECIADTLLSSSPPSLCIVQGLFSRSSITQSTKGEGHEKERCQAQVRFIHLCLVLPDHSVASSVLCRICSSCSTNPSAQAKELFCFEEGQRTKATKEKKVKGSVEDKEKEEGG